ncbi:FAD-dependent oxidoreductase [Lysinibacillus sp. MHQ-1]|nr:FAD-dependent oxidoreductase [Lysinibacillus sp. MHQ-1]
MLQDLNKTISIDGEPVTTVVTRWRNAMPQYTVGHEAKVQRIKQELREHFPTVKLAGSSFEGISIPECVQQGKHVAEEVLAEIFLLVEAKIVQTLCLYYFFYCSKFKI